jgi:arginyl-tRNA synthetase
MIEDPFGEFRRECEFCLSRALEALYTVPEEILMLDIPPKPEMGELASSLPFDLSKRLHVSPRRIAEEISNIVDLSEAELVESVEAGGSGYINFLADYSKLSRLTLETVIGLEDVYGYVKTTTPSKVIVEHTSVNPVGPIHVGSSRNSLIGDSISRLLRARGHEVSTHFYVDDVGRQMGVVAYGRKMLDEYESKGKSDHWIGLLYAATSCIIAIRTLNSKIQLLKEKPDSERDLDRVKKDLEEWRSAAREIRSRDVGLYERLSQKIDEDDDPDESIGRITRLYEAGDSKVKNLVRMVVDLCLEGFKKTFSRVGVFWDSWDWESDLVWSGAVSEVIKKLIESPYTIEVDGVPAVNVEHVSQKMGLKKRYSISEELKIPHLILQRSDGTTLYTTRDVAYSLWKFKHADKVINVIGSEQSLAQLQLKIVLSILTSPEKAESLIHYAYGLVDLPGYKMSKRMGRYITFDEILDEAIRRAYREVEERSPQLPNEEKEDIAEAVGIGAVKYALLNVASTKKVVFTWDRVLNFETNSAPFIQYAHARACNILKRSDSDEIKPEYGLFEDSSEKLLIRTIAIFPGIFINASESFQPNIVAGFANDLASKFNSFYAKLPVLKAESIGLRDARLALVKSTKIVLRNSLNLLGIEPLERM